MDIADYSKGNGYSKSDLTENGTPIILYGRLYTKYQFAIDEVDTFATPKDGSIYSQGNEVIIPASGETAEDIARASAVEKSGILLGGDLNILRPFNFINPLFLALTISNGEPQKELAKKAQGKSIVHIHNSDIQEVTVSFPIRAEQDRIVAVFCSLDNLITLHQKKCFLRSLSSFSIIAISWEQRKLGDIASSFAYGLNAAAKEFDGKHKYLRITDIDDVSRVFQDDNLTSPDADIDAADDYRLEEGDLLFARTGASVGKSYIYKESDGLVYYAGFLIRAKIHPEYDAEFVFQNTLTSTYEKYIKTTSQRSGQPGVNAKEYAEYSMSLPEYAEQVKIGMFLRKIDDAITLHQRKLDDIKLLKKSMLQKMFPAEGRDVPEVRFPGFTAAWEQRKLFEMATFSKGSGYSKADLAPSGTPIILYGRMYTKYETIIKEVDTFAEEKAGSVYSKGGEVIVPASGETAEDISRASVVENTGVLLGGDINIIHPNDNLIPGFLALTISNGNQQKKLSAKAQGASIVHLHNEDLKDVDILYPTIAEQRKISEFFQGLDDTITLHQRKCDDLQKLKKALLQQMFC